MIQNEFAGPRYFKVAIALSVLSAVAWGVVLYSQHRKLSRFCMGVQVGTSISQVREAAQRQDLDPRMEPFAQMSVEPLFWPLPAKVPSCRVFFNKSRFVEYRLLQGV